MKQEYGKEKHKFLKELKEKQLLFCSKKWEKSIVLLANKGIQGYDKLREKCEINNNVIRGKV